MAWEIKEGFILAQIVKEITVDVAKRNLFQAIVAKQHDSNSRFLKVTLTNEGATILVDATSTITINAKRADGLSKPFDGVVNDDGTVTVPLTSWMLELDDTVVCDISVIDIASRKLTSTSFELEVETASCGNEAIEGDERYDLLLNLIGSVTEVSDDCRRAIQEANEAAAKANEAAAKANEAAGGDDSMGEGGYAPPQDGIPLTDLSQEVRLLLERAATAMQTGTDIRTTGIEVDTYANSSAVQYGGVLLETEDTGYGGVPVLKLTSMATGNKVRISGLADPQNETEAATMGYVIAYVAQNLKEGVDGVDAVIWCTDVAPSSSIFVISDLSGPADAVPSPGQMVISSYTGRGYFITAVDDGAVTIANYSVQITGSPGKNGTPGADGGYYTINVGQLNSQSVQISFTPSNEGMPPILPEVITLPQGPQGIPGTSPAVSVSAITEGHRITITDASGKKTVDVLDGEDGDPGKAGNGIKSAVLNADYTLTLTFDDGTSYTTPSIRGTKGADGRGIKSIAKTSGTGAAGTTDTYTITYTDNTTSTFTVYNGKNGANGSPGANGYTPVKGVDYWTEADQESIVQQAIVALGAKIVGYVGKDGTITLRGGDLPDGTYTLKYEDAEGNVTVIGTLVHDADAPDYTNQIPLSLDADGSVFNGVGYQAGSRISASSGTVSAIANPNAENAVFLTGYIPVKKGDVIRLKNCWMDTTENLGDSCIYGHRTWALNVIFYVNIGDTSGASATWDNLDETTILDAKIDSANRVYEFTVNSVNSYMRITLGGPDPAQAILTINEEIE